MISSPDKQAPYAVPEEETALTVDTDLERQKLGRPVENRLNSTSIFLLVLVTLVDFNTCF